MISPETSPKTNPDKKDSDKLEALKSQYEKLVLSSGLGIKEKEECLNWIKQGKNYEGKKITPEDLGSAIANFSRHETVSSKLVSEYKEKIRQLSAQGFFSKNEKRQQSYLDWFRNLPFKDPRAEVDKIRAFTKSDLDKPERKRMKEMFNKLPKAVREKLQKKYDDNGLEENLRMLTEALKRHEKLKSRFLALPGKIQKEYKEIFKKIGDFDEREKLLSWIENKRDDLIQQYHQKIRSLQQPDKHGLTLLSAKQEGKSDSSLQLYIKWFSKLSLWEMNKYLQHSDLDKPERELYRNQMAEILCQLPKEEQIQATKRFNESELTGRRLLIEHYLGKSVKTSSSEKPLTQEWVDSTIRQTALNPSRYDVKRKIETFSILREVGERVRRTDIHFNTSTIEGRQKAVRKHDMAKEDRKTDGSLRDSTQKEENLDKNNILKLKRSRLEYDSDMRLNLKRTLKPDIENRDALLTNVRFEREGGGEMNTREFQENIIPKALEDVKKAVFPIIKEKARASGKNTDKERFTEMSEKADYKKISKQILRKAA